MTYLYIAQSEQKLLDAMFNHLCIECDDFKAKKDILDINDPDVHVFFDTKSNSIGIEEIKTFAKKLNHKPFKREAQFALIYPFEKLTVEAQNALLKTLEEHSAFTHYILGAINQYYILDTVKSRSKIIFLQEENRETLLSEPLEQLVDTLLSKTTPLHEKYETINSSKYTKQETQEILQIFYQKISKDPILANQVLALLNQANKYLSANVSPKQVLLFLLLSIDNKV